MRENESLLMSYQQDEEKLDHYTAKCIICGESISDLQYSNYNGKCPRCVRIKPNENVNKKLITITLLLIIFVTSSYLTFTFVFQF